MPAAAPSALGGAALPVVLALSFPWILQPGEPSQDAFPQVAGQLPRVLVSPDYSSWWKLLGVLNAHPAPN